MVFPSHPQNHGNSSFERVGSLPRSLSHLIPGLTAKDAGAFLSDIGGHHEGADVHANAVVEIGLPADRLLCERLPADEDVVGRFAFEDPLQLFLELLRCDEAGVTAGLARGDGGLLAAIQSPR